MHNQSRRACRGGFTLVETMVALALTGLLFVGAINLYTATLAGAARSQAQSAAGARAAQAVQRVMDDVQEASQVTLPTDTASPTFTPPDGVLGDYEANGVASAIQITAPAVSPSTVLNSGGNAGTVSLYNIPSGSQGAVLTIYRSDTSGTPRPADGQCLWALGTENGVALPAGGARVALLSDTPSISAGMSNAVQFARLSGATSKAAVEVLIIARDYSLIGGSQGSDSSATPVIGKCALSREGP